MENHYNFLYYSPNISHNSEIPTVMYCLWSPLIAEERSQVQCWSPSTSLPRVKHLGQVHHHHHKYFSTVDTMQIDGKFKGASTLLKLLGKLNPLFSVSKSFFLKLLCPRILLQNLLKKSETIAVLDVSTSMTYIPGTGPQSLFPSVHLTLCPDLCPVSHVETRITLHDHETDTCDRDTYDIISQRKMCGASNNAIDLLSENISPEIVFNNSTDDDDDDAVGEAAIRFSGEEGVVVPSDLVSHDFGPEFTIHTWMRHARKVGKQSKEQIVCLSDDHRKSRHHTALFIRNCKLVFLNRRHYQEEERNVFKPAEWRWSLPQVCDNRWHHYAVSV